MRIIRIILFVLLALTPEIAQAELFPKTGKKLSDFETNNCKIIASAKSDFNSDNIDDYALVLEYKGFASDKEMLKKYQFEEVSEDKRSKAKDISRFLAFNDHIPEGWQNKLPEYFIVDVGNGKDKLFKVEKDKMSADVLDKLFLVSNSGELNTVRILVIVLGNKDGQYTKIVENPHVISGAKIEGGQIDGFLELGYFEAKGASIKYSSVEDRTVRSYGFANYNFKYIKDGFYLIGYEYNSTQDSNKWIYSYNYLTQKQKISYKILKEEVVDYDSKGVPLNAKGEKIKYLSGDEWFNLPDKKPIPLNEFDAEDIDSYVTRNSIDFDSIRNKKK